MSCAPIFSPRPIRSWAPMPSASPPPYEPYETYDTPGPSAHVSATVVPPPAPATVPGPVPAPFTGPAPSFAPAAAHFHTTPSLPPPHAPITSFQNFHGHPVPVDFRRSSQQAAAAATSTTTQQASSAAQSKNQINHLRNALSHLESRMALLLSERDLLESRLESAVRMQSPVQRLPSELLASIFIMGVMNMEEDDSLMLSTLMLVCRHWLEVAVNTPILWTRIAAGVRHPISHAQRKLERSKALPLHICVDFSPRTENGTVTR